MRFIVLGVLWVLSNILHGNNVTIALLSFRYPKFDPLCPPHFDI